MMMNSFSCMEFDKVSGEEVKLVNLEYFSFQSEFTNSLFEFEDKILSSGKYDSYLSSAASFLAFPDLENISINPLEESLEEYGSVSWTAKESMFDEDKREDCNLVEKTETQTTKKMRGRGEFASDCSVSKPLSKETISLYYHMSLSQAAKELNMCSTLLKRKCRDLGIHRWPHRKWMSLQNLINNVEEKLEKGEGDAVDQRNVLEKLTKEKKMIVECPDLEVEDETKRLRQACYNAIRKWKRRLVMSTSIDHLTSSSLDSIWHWTLVRESFDYSS